MEFKVLEAILQTIIAKSHIIIGLAVVIGAVAFVVAHKSVRIYQKALSKMVEQVKDLKNSYENSLDETEQKKLLKKYKKALRKLDNKIRSVVSFNSKKIYIATDLLEDNSNLALSGQEPFVFRDRLYSIINQGKKKTEINQTSKGKKIVHAVEEINLESNNIPYTTLSEAHGNNFSLLQGEGHQETKVYNSKEDVNEK